MTVTAVTTLKKALNLANPNDIAAVLRLLAVGDMLDVVSETVTLSAVAGTADLTVVTAAKKAALHILALDVTDITGGAGSEVGVCVQSNVAPAAIVTSKIQSYQLSADGKTITFLGTIKAFKIKYLPMPATALSSAFPMT